MKSTTTSSLDYILLLCLLAAVFFVLLGSRPLFVPDEGRYAEIAREMVVRGDFITPFLNGIKYFEKPILFYWLGALSIKIAGLSLWSLRSINAVLGLLGCIATYYTATCLYASRRTGFMAALVLGSSWLYVCMARMITLDLPVTFFLTLSLYSFLIGIESRKRKFFLMAYAFAAFAVLTKGLIGIVFPGLIIGLWIFIENRWRLLLQMSLFTGLLLFTAIALPWHLLVQYKNPEFYHFYIVEQHFLRFTLKEIGHYQPAWFFIPCLVLGFFPWITFLPQALYRGLRTSDSFDLFFILWAVVIFAFFSISQSKLIPYILPIFPPLAILLGRYFATPGKAKGLGFFLALLLSLLLAIAIHFLPLQKAPDFAQMKLYFFLMSGSLIFGSFLAYVFSRFSTIAFSLTFFYSSLFILLFFAAFPALDSRSIYPLAQVLRERLQAQDTVITYNRYYQDLPFYLEREVSILNWRNELAFGFAHQANVDWLIDDVQFWQAWHGENKTYALLGLDDFKRLSHTYPQEKFLRLKQTTTNVLIANRE
jgi:4-amino-4-deoxy-L-arabinose transferase-like glycosyltransferase